MLAFHQNSDGSLTQFASFNTGGTGQINLPKVIGPDDSSQEVVATPDGRFLFAVNQGSNSVSSFRIDRDGTLHLIGTFDSGGVQPDSIGIAGNKLYVSNRGDSAVGHPGTVAPNITGFRIRGDGMLAPIPDSTVTFPVDTSPSQNLISPNGRLLFADIFAVPGSTAAQGNTLAPFQIEHNGSLNLAPGGNVGAPANPPLLLGAAFNPNQRIIYAGLTAVNEVAVFTYDKSGQLTFVGDVPVQGGGPCWAAVSADGRFLYTGDTGTDSIGVFSLADPLHPVQIQELVLGGPHAPPGSPSGTLETNVFQIALSPDGHYSVCHQPVHRPDRQFPGWQPAARPVGGRGRHAERAERPGPPVHGRRSRRRPSAGHRGGHDEGARERWLACISERIRPLERLISSLSSSEGKWIDGENQTRCGPFPDHHG